MQFTTTILQMEHSTSALNERVLRVPQLAKLSFNHPSVVLTADVFQLFRTRFCSAPRTKMCGYTRFCQFPFFYKKLENVSFKKYGVRVLVSFFDGAMQSRDLSCSYTYSIYVLSAPECL